MESGDILGHEFMGEVVDVGRGVKNVKKGGKIYPLAWDLARELGRVYTLKDERIWAQDNDGPGASFHVALPASLRRDRHAVVASAA